MLSSCHQKTYTALPFAAMATE